MNDQTTTTVKPQNSLDKLAKLLAAENITVEHSKAFKTASFDLKHRILRLPVWKEMSPVLYHMLVLHEVSHALNTPMEEWRRQLDYFGRRFKGFLNIVEDARIERKIKIKFPGSKRDFVEGYRDLFNQNFFKLAGRPLEKMSLINRINLHFKIGALIDIPFTAEEQVYVDRVAATMTFDEAVSIAAELFDRAAKKDEQNDVRDSHSDYEDSDGESDGDEDGEGQQESELGEDDDDSEDGETSDDSEEEEDGDESEDESSEDDDSDSEAQKRSKSKKDDKTEKSKDDKSDSEDDQDADGQQDRPNDNKSSSVGNKASRGGDDSFKSWDPSREEESDTSTEEDLRESLENDLIDPTAIDRRYVDLDPCKFYKDHIFSYKTILSEIEREYQLNYSPNDRAQMKTAAANRLKSFKDANAKTIAYLAKEFEMKKAADMYSRQRESKSGVINPTKLHSYKMTDDIFRRITVVPGAKNHGLVMFIDFSASMIPHIRGTIAQLLNLVMFCRKVNIPHRVYAFQDVLPGLNSQHNSVPVGYAEKYARIKARTGEGLDHTKRETGKFYIGHMMLMELFHDKMRNSEINQMMTNLMDFSGHYTRPAFRRPGAPNVQHHRTRIFNLNGTPLNDAIMLARPLIKDFRSESEAQIVNAVFLTDGESGGTDYHMQENGYLMTSSKYERVVMRDKQTTMEGEFTDVKSQTEFFIKVLRKYDDVHAICFRLVGKNEVRRYVSAKHGYTEFTEAMAKAYAKTKFVNMENFYGFDDFYVIPGGADLDIEDTTMENLNMNATKGTIARAFMKANANRNNSRVLLTRFIERIAA